MKRRLTLLLASCLAVAVPVCTAATDAPYRVLIDGRGVDKLGWSALQHDGVVYIDVVRAVKTFDGLLTFGHEGLLRILIGGRTLDLALGSKSALLDGTTRIRLPGAPFKLNGTTYVPIGVVAKLGKSSVSFDPKHHTVNLLTGHSIGFAPTVPANPNGNDEVLPSAAIALSIVPSAVVERDGLHATATIANKLTAPYVVSFPSSNQVAFVVERNGNEIWNSSAAKSPGPASTLDFSPNETITVSAIWPDFAKAGAGSYTLRVRLLTLIPVETSPLSIGVATPGPSPT
jgi:hypothetical protein